jgi:hypothetical protein
MRTLGEPCLWSRFLPGTDELRQAVAEFVVRLGRRMPFEAFNDVVVAQRA